MAKQYILVVAPPGVGVSSATAKLERRLDAQTRDIEEELISDPQTVQALDEIRAPYTEPINMGTVTHYLPRSRVANLWKRAVARCLEDLRKSDKPCLILSGHLIYYSGQRHEFYGVVAPDSLARTRGPVSLLKPGCILALLDDIYDMYTRLPELYSSSQLESFLRKQEREKGYLVDRLPKDRQSSLVMGWHAANLLHLLQWRQIESLAAANLALQLDLRLLVWSVKQLIDPVVLWVQDGKSTPIYLSHSISEATRQKKETGNWPSFVQEVNSLQRSLLEHGVILAMPDGIDELRFEVKDFRRTGRLEHRWPLPGANGELFYSKPSTVTSMHYHDLLRPRAFDRSKRAFIDLKPEEYGDNLKWEINAYLNLASGEMEAQTASRDFLLVYHTMGLLVYRPYYATKPRPTFSRGVKSEVDLWKDIVRLGHATKRIAFVHFESDVASMLEAGHDRVRDDFIDVLRRLMCTEVPNVSRAIVQNMVDNQGRLQETASVLSRAEIAERDRAKLERSYSDHWQSAKAELLHAYLTGLLYPEQANMTGVWVAKDFASLPNRFPEIVSFLKQGDNPGRVSQAQVNRLLPDNRVYAKISP